MADKPSNVVNLEGEFFWKQLKNRLKRERGALDVFTYGWDASITRVTQDDEVARPTDMVIFSETEAEVREWFTRVGFPMPQTWAEYRAGQWYIHTLTYCIDIGRIGYHHIPKHGFGFIESRYNYLYEPFVLAMQDDQVGVAKRHKRHRTFAKIVREYDESKELPDAAPNKFGNSDER